MLSEPQLQRNFENGHTPVPILPIKFNAFEHFVRKVQSYSNYMIYTLLAYTFKYSIMYFSIKSFLPFVVGLRFVNFYTFYINNTIRKLANRYWYFITDFEKKMRDENRALKECCCYCSAFFIKVTGAFPSEDDEYGCYCSISLKDADLLGSEVKGSIRYCSMRVFENDAGAASNNHCYCSVFGEKDTGGFVEGNDIDGEDNIHVPGDEELVDNHSCDDDSLIGAVEGSEETDLSGQNSKVNGNIASSFLDDLVKSFSLVDEKVDNTNAVLQSFVEEKECSDSDTSFSKYENDFKQTSNNRRFLSRVRRSICSYRVGAPKFVRLRPLRRYNDFYSRSSPTWVKCCNLNSCNDLKSCSSLDEQRTEEVETNFCEPIKIDSFESNFIGCEELVGCDVGSSCVGLSTVEEGSLELMDVNNLLLHTFIPDSQPCEKIFLEDSVPMTNFTFISNEVNSSVSFEHLLVPVLESDSIIKEPSDMFTEVQQPIEFMQHELIGLPLQEIEFSAQVQEESSVPALQEVCTAVSSNEVFAGVLPSELTSTEPFEPLLELSSTEPIVQEEIDADTLNKEVLEDEIFAGILVSALSSTVPVPLAEGAMFSSEDLFQQLYTASEPTLEDPFDSKPINQMVTSSSSSTNTNQPGIDAKKAARLKALFEESEEEEDNESAFMELLHKRDDRKILKPKSIRRRS